MTDLLFVELDHGGSVQPYLKLRFGEITTAAEAGLAWREFQELPGLFLKAGLLIESSVGQGSLFIHG